MIGLPVLMMDYPVGIDRLFSILPMEEMKRLRKRYQGPSALLSRSLARHNRLNPVMPQGQVFEVYNDRIICDETCCEGRAWSAQARLSRRVIGINGINLALFYSL